ncbi:hypothetical protein BHE74_00024267, partial [Ensete ventricosum]
MLGRRGRRQGFFNFTKRSFAEESAGCVGTKAGEAPSHERGSCARLKSRAQEEGEEEEGEKYLARTALPRFPRAVRRLRAKNCPGGEKERGD